MAEAASIASTDRTGRLGVMYLRSLLAQAGVAHNETDSGEDHLAVDLNVNFASGTARVQVKTGTKRCNKDGSISVAVTEAWKRRWAASVLPVYVVYVRLEKAPPADWIDHEDVHTVVHARALWMRVNSVDGKSVRLPAHNRLTAETFDAWASEFEATATAWGRAAGA